MPTEGRELHLELVSALADELRLDRGALIGACDIAGAQAVECDWEDEWPTRAPRKRHGWKTHAIASSVWGANGHDIHLACLTVGVLFLQAGDRRAGTSAVFR
jgi:hypothetical protein